MCLSFSPYVIEKYAIPVCGPPFLLYTLGFIANMGIHLKKIHLSRQPDEASHRTGRSRWYTIGRPYPCQRVIPPALKNQQKQSFLVHLVKKQTFLLFFVGLFGIENQKTFFFFQYPKKKLTKTCVFWSGAPKSFVFVGFSKLVVWPSGQGRASQLYTIGFCLCDGLPRPAGVINANILIVYPYWQWVPMWTEGGPQTGIAYFCITYGEKDRHIPTNSIYFYCTF